MSEKYPQPVLFEKTPLRADHRILGFSDGHIEILKTPISAANSNDAPVTPALPADAPAGPPGR
jgi:hypothetical protein